MIGVFGGTFDPVHFGHLRTALEVKDGLALQQLRLLPCRLPPHRDRPVVNAEQREAMLRVAINDEIGLCVDARELKRDGPSYSVDTLTTIRDEIGSAIPTCLIVGMDAFADLESWYRWQTLFELAHIVVMHRPGYRPSLPQSLQAFILHRTASGADALHSNPSGLVLFQEVIQLDISATHIRDLIRHGKSPRYLLPDSVLKMIRENHLYT